MRLGGFPRLAHDRQERKASVSGTFSLIENVTVDAQAVRPFAVLRPGSKPGTTGRAIVRHTGNRLAGWSHEDLEKSTDWGGRALVLVIIVAVTVYQSRKNLVTVQTGKAQKQNLASVVSASGEIKPKTYVNIGANAFGKIVKLHVKEGDRVKRGQLLAQLENVQSSADVNAMRASLAGSRNRFHRRRCRY